MNNAIGQVAAATAKAETSTINIFNQHIANAKKLNNEYNIIQQKGIAVTESIVHQKKLENTVKSLESTIHAYQKNKKDINISTWLNSLKNWSLEGYKEINSFRSFITGGQQLIYEVMNTEGVYVYKMEEDDFIKLLASRPLRTRASWDSLNTKNITNLLQLSVDNPTLQKLSSNVERIQLKKDALYGFIKSKTPEMEKNRRLELYSQIRSDYGDKELDSKTKRKISYFIKGYVQTKDLSNDTIKFYQTGDAIKDNMTLIENKVGGTAIVSIQTIKNAIKDIADLGIIGSPSILAERLKSLFTYVGTESLAKKIQEGVAETARKAIDEMINSLNSGGYFK